MVVLPVMHGTDYGMRSLGRCIIAFSFLGIRTLDFLKNTGHAISFLTI